MKTILITLFALFSISSLRAQLIAPVITPASILSPVAQAIPELLVGYGDDGVWITHSGETELLIHLESTELDIANPDEWTVSWLAENGEAYHLAYLEDDIYVIGDDNNIAVDISQNITDIVGVPSDFDYYLVSTLAKDLVNHVDEAEGSVTYTLGEALEVGADLLGTALAGIQNNVVDVQAIAVNAASAIVVSGNPNA